MACSCDSVSVGRQLEQRARLGDRCRAAGVFGAQACYLADEGRVRRCQRVLVEAHVVFHAGAAMAVELERPARELELVAAEARTGPGGVGRQAVQGLDVELEDLA